MVSIYELQHTIVRNGTRSRKGLGVFTSKVLASDFLEQVKSKPGFTDPRGAFKIHEATIGTAYLPKGLDSQWIETLKVENSTSVLADHVFALYNVNTQDSAETDDDFVLIGYYASHADADKAGAAMVTRFPAQNRAFEVHRSQLDRGEWSEGFGP